MKAEFIIFDLDGTLFNTKAGIIAAIKRAVKEEGLKQLSDDEYDTFIGPPIEKTFARVYGLSDEEGLRVAQVFRGFYGQDEYLLQTSEYPDMRNVLIKLKERGIKTALATYKRETMAEKICKHFGYDRLLTVIHGSDPEGKLTKADIINLCIKELGCDDPQKAVMLGDSIHDSKGAKGAGTGFAGVTYGFGFKNAEDINEAFEGAAVINEAKEILAL